MTTRRHNGLMGTFVVVAQAKNGRPSRMALTDMDIQLNVFDTVAEADARCVYINSLGNSTKYMVVRYVDWLKNRSAR